MPWKKWGVFILSFIFVAFFAVLSYTQNKTNYITQKRIEFQVVTHPEFLPKPDTAKLSSVGFQNLMADIYWLKTIQYIWGNAASGEYKKYIYEMMHLITELNPYFETPYNIGQLLIPSLSGESEAVDEATAEKYSKNAELIGLKGIKNFCDTEKIQMIFEQWDLQKIISDPAYSNPCKGYKIPYYLAYLYYYYMHDGEKSAQYYKVVSAQDDAPEWARVLAAIMQGKSGAREKSIFMFLSLAKSTGQDDEACTLLTTEIEKASYMLFQNKMPLQEKMVQEIENYSKEILPKFDEKKEEELLSDTKCTNFLAKAIREINLLYLDQADTRYTEKFPEETSARTTKKLKEAGIIDFIPTDYQQYTDHGIVYEYNPDIGRFDYEMWDFQ